MPNLGEERLRRPAIGRLAAKQSGVYEARVDIVAHVVARRFQFGGSGDSVPASNTGMLAWVQRTNQMKVLERLIDVFDQVGGVKSNSMSLCSTDASSALAMGDGGSRLDSTRPIAWLGAGSTRLIVTRSGIPPKM